MKPKKTMYSRFEEFCEDYSNLDALECIKIRYHSDLAPKKVDGSRNSSSYCVEGMTASSLFLVEKNLD